MKERILWFLAWNSRKTIQTPKYQTPKKKKTFKKFSPLYVCFKYLVKYKYLIYESESEEECGPWLGYWSVFVASLGALVPFQSVGVISDLDLAWKSIQVYFAYAYIAFRLIYGCNALC